MWSEALLLNRDQGRASVTSKVLLNLGYTELALGNLDPAADLVNEALILGRELEDDYVVPSCLLSLGTAATLQGEPRHAEELIKEALAIDLELEGETDTAELLEGFAEAAGALRQDLRAARLWGAAAALREATDWPWWHSERLLHEPQLAAARRRLDEAAWEAAFDEGKATGIGQAIEYALSEEGTATVVPPTSMRPLADARLPL